MNYTKNKSEKTALITGITGQDGSYLAELLLSKGYNVYGLIRRLSTPNLKNIEEIKNRISLIDGDLLDQASIINAVKRCEPDEIYNLGAQSFVGSSWQQAEFTISVTGLGALKVFEATRMVEDYLGKKIKIYQASSSEMYGLAEGASPQNEDTIMKPRSPYGVAKLMAHETGRVYRESYGMWISCGICFNHSGPRRGVEFVTRKISDGVARIKYGIEHKLVLGDIRAKRDWTDARDIVNGMWMILNNTDRADDFVLASGESHSVRDVCEVAFKRIGLNWEMYTEFNKELQRPAEIFELKGDYSKAKNELGWSPKISFKKMIEEMVDNDINILAGFSR